MNKASPITTSKREFSYFIQQFKVLSSLVKDVETPTVAISIAVERRFLKPHEEMEEKMKRLSKDREKNKENFYSYAHCMKMINKCYESNLEKQS